MLRHVVSRIFTSSMVITEY